MHGCERKSKLRSTNGIRLSPKGFFLLSSLILMVTLTSLAMGQDTPDIQELRRQIDANGWNFEVDDTFSKSASIR